MSRTQDSSMAWMKAGIAYFLLVFVVGFALGTVRVLVLVPRLGELFSTLVELPVILLAAWEICRRLQIRFSVPAQWRPRIGMGALALALLTIAETGVSVLAFGRSLAEHVSAYRSAHTMLGLAGQLLYAAFPVLQLVVPGSPRAAEPAAREASGGLLQPKWSEARVGRQLRDQGYNGGSPTVAWFGDDARQFDELAELVRSGRKWATAGLLWRWEERGGPPRPGGRQTIVDAQGNARAVIEFTAVRVVPFDDVDAQFAKEEGEGDLSLEYWRRVHWAFFVRECKRLGREPSGSMPIVCMSFRVVHAA